MPEQVKNSTHSTLRDRNTCLDRMPSPHLYTHTHTTRHKYDETKNTNGRYLGRTNGSTLRMYIVNSRL